MEIRDPSITTRPGEGVADIHDPLPLIDELIRSRSSPAAKAALRSLIETPAATAPGRRGKTKA